MARPFLRWAGSKKRIVNDLIEYWDAEKSTGYIEPFAGSAQLYFKIDPKRALLSDINGELINAYKEIKKKPKLVADAITTLKRGKRSYYKLRSQSPLLLNPIERAARFIFLNRYCFNGLYRTNLKGEFNVPYAGIKTGNLPTLEDLNKVSLSLRNARLVQGDFEEVVKKFMKAGDFVYLDPPYAATNIRIFNQYNPQTFGLDDLGRLSTLLNHIDKAGNKFLVSYFNGEEAKELFRKWNMTEIKTQRYMKGFGKSGKPTKELLIFN